MKKLCRFCALTAIMATLCPLEISICGPADSTLTFDIDFARFKMNDSTAVVEVYIAVPRHRLTFVAEGAAIRAGFTSEINILREDSVLIQHRWSADNLAHHQDEIHPGQLLFTQAQFQVPTGEYKLLARIEDDNSGVSGRKMLPLAVGRFSATDLAVSDLELACLISKDSTASLYFKNNFKVVPNPSALYGTGMPIVYTYAEIYNLSFPSDSTYEVAYRVLDGNGQELKAPAAKRRHVAGASVVEVNALNIATMPSGSYSLQCRVRDLRSGQQTIQTRKFFVYREQDAAAPEAESGMAGALAEHYRRRSISELDEEFGAARYIATQDEQKVFVSLTEDAKRDFLVGFWTRRDQTPSTARNEYRDDYLSRVDYANRTFSGLRNGWRTDMGRVLLTYGYPSEIERVPSSGESRAYQEWKYYELEGGAEFHFVDLKGWGNYELVNSTARTELHDPDWQRWLNVQ